MLWTILLVTICVRRRVHDDDDDNDDDDNDDNDDDDDDDDDDDTLFVGVCSAGSGDTGTCLAQLTLPSHWWPPLASPGHTPAKVPRLLASVYYSVRPGGRPVSSPPRPMGEVRLTASGSGYQQLAGDEFLHLLVPQSPLYPGSRLYVPVFVEQPQDASPVSVIVIKCRARRGVRILGIEETSGDWTLRMDINNKGSVATVTAFRKDATKLASKEYTG